MNNFGDLLNHAAFRSMKVPRVRDDSVEKFLAIVLEFQKQTLTRLNQIEARLNKLEEKPKFLHPLLRTIYDRSP